MERIKEWKARVYMAFEDDKLVKSAALFSQLLKETLEFKFSIKLIKELEAIIASYKWIAKAKHELSGEALTTLEILQELIDTGKANNYDPATLSSLTEIMSTATNYKTILVKMLNSGKISDADELEDLQKKGEKISVDLKGKQTLAKMLIDVRLWRSHCIALLNGTCKINELEQVKKEAEKLKITCKEYEKLCENMQPVLQWLASTNRFLDKFKATDTEQIDKVVASLKKKTTPAMHLQNLMKTASDISKLTEEFNKLNTMQHNLENWEKKAQGVINSYVQEKKFSKEEIFSMIREGYHFPIGKDLAFQMQDICEHATWIQHANEVLNSKVPVHILEATIREGNGFSVKTPDIKAIVIQLEEKVGNAKKWLAKYKQLKLNVEKRQEKMQLAELEQVLKEGEGLNVKIREMEMLFEIYNEIKKLQQDALSSLQGNISYTALETLINTIEGYEISVPEQQLLKALYKVCNTWHKISIQVIRSRSTLSLSLLNSLPAAKTAMPFPDMTTNEQVLLILNKCDNGSFSFNTVQAAAKQENQNLKKKEEKIEYCVCRQGNDCDQNMIACDECNEWFHLECINLPKEKAKKFPQYICMACAKRKDLNFYYAECLDNIQRINEKNFYLLIQEGHRLPVQFTELKLLEEVRTRVEEWKQRALKIFSQGIQYELYVEFFENKQRIRTDKVQETQRIENYIMKLILESENFPVETELSHQLMLLIKQKDWVREALKVRYSKISFRKRKLLIEKAEKLNITSKVELKELYNDLQAMSAKFNENGNGKLNGFESENRPIFITETNPVGNRGQDLERWLKQALRTRREEEKVIYGFYEELSSIKKNPKDSLLVEASQILEEASNFRKKSNGSLYKQSKRPSNT